MTNEMEIVDSCLQWNSGYVKYILHSMRTEILLILICLLWINSQCNNGGEILETLQDSPQINLPSQPKTILVGISIREFVLLSKILDLFPIPYPDSNFTDQYHFQWRLCFDWSPGSFLASDTFFVDFLYQHRNEMILIERFQPDDFLNPSLCGLSVLQQDHTKFDGFLHVPITSSDWITRIHSALAHIMLACGKDDTYEDKIYCFDSFNDASITNSYPINSTAHVVSESKNICYIPTIIKSPIIDVSKHIASGGVGSHNIHKDNFYQEENYYSKTISQLQNRLHILQTQHSLRSNLCQLWWPWNQSEIFLHQPISPKLSLLRLRTKTIVRCDINGRHPDTIPHYLEVIDYFYPKNSSFSSAITTLHSLFDEDLNGNSILTQNTQQWTVFDIENILHITAFHPSNIPKVHCLRILSSSGQELSFFEIHQPLSFGNQDIHFIRAGNRQLHAHIHHMVSQLDSRDDLGFAFSMLLSPQHTGEATSRAGKVWVEIGVQAGEYAELILRTTVRQEISTFVGVDAWQAWSQEEYVDMANVPDRENAEEVSHHMQCRNQAEARLSGFDMWCSEDEFVEVDKNQHFLCHRNRFLLAMPSLQAVNLFEDHSVDVVFIDAMHHYLAVWKDILAWWPKVKPCGLLAGHDFLLTTIHANNPGSYDTIFTVKPAVQEFARHLGLFLFMTHEEEQPAFPSWLLFKPCEEES